MQHLKGSGTPVIYIWDAWFLKVNNSSEQRIWKCSGDITKCWNEKKSKVVTLGAV
jgi:hypothetical protein